MSDFRTTNFSLASFLRYLGVRHLATQQVPPRGIRFVFADDEERCRAYADEFFSEQGAAVSDARGLLECGRDLKRTVTDAMRSAEGSWLAEGTAQC